MVGRQREHAMLADNGRNVDDSVVLIGDAAGLAYRKWRRINRRLNRACGGGRDLRAADATPRPSRGDADETVRRVTLAGMVWAIPADGDGAGYSTLVVIRHLVINNGFARAATALTGCSRFGWCRSSDQTIDYPVDGTLWHPACRKSFELQVNSGRHTQRRICSDVGWKARALGRQWSLLRRLGDVPHQGLASGSKSFVRLAIIWLVRADDPALKRRREDMGTSRE